MSKPADVNSRRKYGYTYACCSGQTFPVIGQLEVISGSFTVVPSHIQLIKETGEGLPNFCLKSLGKGYFGTIKNALFPTSASPRKANSAVGMEA